MRKISIAFLFILLCASWFTTFPCEAATVWSDDFDDGDYEGWTVVYGSFSAENSILEIQGPRDWNLVYHPSSITTGTWSFDLLAPTPMTYVMFMGSDPSEWSAPLSYPDEGRFYRMWGSFIRLGKRAVDDRLKALVDTTLENASGWQHFDITCDSDGRICVYHNGTLFIDKVDTSDIQSEFFVFCASGTTAIDNIVVSDTIDIQSTPSTPFYMETWFLATTGAGVLVAAIVIIAVMMRRK